MKSEVIERKEKVFNFIQETEDEKVINSLCSFINGYYSQKPDEDPRQNNLGPDFWDRKDTEVNMYNVKYKLMENIEMLPEDYVTDLRILHRLYGITKLQLERVAERDAEIE